MSIFFSRLFRYKDAKSPDVLGLYPERVHISSIPERRYLWTSRIMAICGVFSICITIMLTLTIYVLLPQRKSIPALYYLNDVDSIFKRIQKSEIHQAPTLLLTESLIYKYIMLRNEVPASFETLYERWYEDSEFYQLSSIGTYQEFIHKMNNEAMIDLFSKRVHRQVEIDFVRPLTDKFWQAQFKTITTNYLSPEPQTVLWRAYLRIDYITIKDNPEEQEGVHSYDYTKNPYGFKVMRYSVSYMGTDSAATNYMEIAKKVSKLKNDEY